MNKEQLKQVLINSGWFYEDHQYDLQFGYMPEVDMNKYLDDLLNELNKFKE